MSEPRVTVVPKYTLLVERDRVSLEAWLDYSVEKGGLLGAQLVFPSGWRVDEIGPVALVDPGENALMEGDRLNVQFLTRTTDHFRLHLRAHRAFNPAEGPLQVGFPVPDRATVLPATLAVVAAVNVDLAPDFDLMVHLAPGLRDAADPFDLPADLPSFHRAPVFFRIAAKGFEFRADATIQARRSEFDNEVQVELSGTAAEVRQRLLCDIANEPISEIPLVVPESIAESLTLRSEPGSTTFLLREPGTTSEGLVRMKVILGQLRLGPIELLVTFDAPLGMIDQEGSADLTVPFVVPAEESRRRDRARVRVPPTTAVQLRDENWG